MDEDARERFDADIGQIEDPEAVAEEELKKYQKEMGITFENPDVPVQGQPGAEKDEEFF